MSGIVKPFAVDPTVETSDVVIGGKVYRMCLTTRALAQAERELNKLGFPVVLLNGLHPVKLTELDSIVVLFAASIRKFHPEIGFEEAMDLVTLPYIHTVAVALVDAWNKCLPAPEKGDSANPTEAGDAQAAAPVSETENGAAISAESSSG